MRVKLLSAREIDVEAKSRLVDGKFMRAFRRGKKHAA